MSDRRKPPPHSHKNSIFWQFLQSTKPGDGDLGQLVHKLRVRVDMPRHFPHKTAMVKYLYHCKIDTGTVAVNAPRLYALYQEFHKQATHPQDATAVEFVAPEQMAKSGVTRKQIALAVLEGMNIFDNPAQNLAEGGRWADSAFGAADAVIVLFNSFTHKRRNPPDDEQGDAA